MEASRRVEGEEGGGRVEACPPWFRLLPTMTKRDLRISPERRINQAFALGAPPAGTTVSVPRRCSLTMNPKIGSTLSLPFKCPKEPFP